MVQCEVAHPGSRYGRMEDPAHTVYSIKPSCSTKAEKMIEWFSNCYIIKNSVLLAEVVRYS